MLMPQTSHLDLPSGLVKFLRYLETATGRHAADEIVLKFLSDMCVVNASRRFQGHEGSIGLVPQPERQSANGL